MRDRHWILDPNGEPIPAINFIVWAQWFDRNDADARRVAETRTKLFWVSTVFLGLDHNFLGDGPPLTFESMAFRQPRARDIRAVIPESPLIEAEELCDRYTTRAQALAGHSQMVDACLALEALHPSAALDRVLRRKAPSARRAKIWQHRIELARAA